MAWIWSVQLHRAALGIAQSAEIGNLPGKRKSHSSWRSCLSAGWQTPQSRRMHSCGSCAAPINRLARKHLKSTPLKHFFGVTCGRDFPGNNIAPSFLDRYLTSIVFTPPGYEDSRWFGTVKRFHSSPKFLYSAPSPDICRVVLCRLMRHYYHTEIIRNYPALSGSEPALEVLVFWSQVMQCSILM